LKVRVFCLDKERFNPDNNELQLYGYADNQLFAFETIDVVPEDAIDLVDAIKWYANYIQHPAMEILPEDPRPGQHVAMKA
jgi:hypothetical protein